MASNNFINTKCIIHSQYSTYSKRYSTHAQAGRGRLLHFIQKNILCQITATRETTRPPCTLTCTPVHIVTKYSLACKNNRFSSLLAAGGVQRRGKSATQRQKFHTDDHGFARLMSHWVIVLRLYLVVACVNAYNGLLLEGENHYQWVCVCCVLPILCFLMSPLCKKCPNNNNNNKNNNNNNNNNT